MSLGIAIISYNRPAQLRRCIHYITTLTPNAYVVIADDGSDGETVECMLKSGLPYVTGENMGVAWNKNRAIHSLMQARCEQLILIEDDTFPIKVGWVDDWVNAIERYGHINLAGGWFRDAATSGNGTVAEPFVSTVISGQISGFSRQAIGDVGYFDTRFRGYGGEHVDHTKRLIKAGYGGTVENGDYRFFLIESDIVVTDDACEVKLEPASNIETSVKSGEEFWSRFPYRTDDEYKQFRMEQDPLPPDFDAARYRDIHSDVRQFAIDATYHYIRYGRREGRSYKLEGPSSVPRPVKDMAAVIIVKDESASIVEWLAYHYTIGVNAFYIYDNGSSDGTAAVIKSSVLAGVATVINWPENPGQISAYSHFAENFASQFRWVAFIDSDEFIVPLEQGNIIQVLDSYDKRFCCVLPNWLVFGPNGHDTVPAGLTLDNYTARLPDGTDINRHVKSIVRGDQITNVQGVHVIHTNGPACDGAGNTVDAEPILKVAVHKKIVVNHYYTKSLEDWKRKVGRGRADKAADDPSAVRYLDSFYDFANAAVVRDERIVRFSERVKQLIAI
jgi:glycosyltransferase involved in cell wall biosynthesis